MRIKHFIVAFAVVSSIFTGFSQQKKYNVHTIAFYNFENLFDTINGPNNDEEWLPNGAQNWTSEKYHKKLDNLSRVLSEIGTNDDQHNAPVLIGGCEIENRHVLDDLVKTKKLVNYEYGVVHFDSPDKRGIDVALLYQMKHFQPTSFANIPLLIYRNKVVKKEEKEKIAEEDKAETDKIETDTRNRVYTRDILLVTGLLDGEEINVMVNHWPSRSGGEKKSSPFREEAGRLVKRTMDSIYKFNPNAKIIVMGDLNDGTYNKSVKEGVGAKLKKDQVKKFDIYNPFEQMAKDGNASLFYRDAGDIFDQIMVSDQLLTPTYDSWKYWKAGVFNKPYMVQMTGQYKGYPLRHQATEVGFSDHFPVFVYLIKELK
ncbi:MAG: endonuclease/exonuclease/phosphatase family protein [Flavobacterium sp.]|nr:endonuclease/exonuclease/phosphatase family protein [Flavobacterium sp.]